MSYYAKIEDGVVSQVVVSEDCPDSEWIETFIDGGIRKNYAGVGYSYDAQRDAFVAPRPFASWILDEATCTWMAPVPMPSGGPWMWDEDYEEWVEA